MDSKNLTLGRGELWFAPFLPGTTNPGPERWIGNCPQLTMTSEVEVLEHRSSTSGISRKDDETNIETNHTINIETDDLSDENVTVFSMGVATRVAVGALTGQTQTFTNVKAGETYQIGATNSAPEGARRLTGVTVTNGATPTPATLTLNTAYTIDLELGRITFLVDQATAVVNYGASAYSVVRIEAGETKVEGQLRFISRNPKGPLRDCLWPRVRLGPTGDLAFIGENDWSRLPIQGEVLTKGALPPYVMTTRPVIA